MTTEKIKCSLCEELFDEEHLKLDPDLEVLYCPYCYEEMNPEDY